MATSTIKETTTGTFQYLGALGQNASVTINIPGSFRGFIYTLKANASSSYRTEYGVTSTSGGAVYPVAMHSSTYITVTTGTNTITFSNTGSEVHLCYMGTKTLTIAT